jgi:signal transduction histidine kinase/ActR/RegA family two-component response regulator
MNRSGRIGKNRLVRSLCLAYSHHQLSLVCLPGLGILLLVGVLTYFSFDRIERETVELTTHVLPKLKWIEQMERESGVLAVSALRCVSIEDAEESAECERRVAEAKRSNELNLRTFELGIDSESERERYQHVAELSDPYVASCERVLAFIREDRHDQAEALVEAECWPLHRAYDQALASVRRTIEAEAGARSESAAEGINQARRLGYGLLLLGILSGPAAGAGIALVGRKMKRDNELLRAEVRERLRVEGEIRRLNEMLDQRVRERTEELSDVNAELERASRMKDEFLANMSHELRTPLNAILGLSEALQDQIYGPLSERQLGSMRGIEESGRHLLALINEILDLARAETGKLELNIGTVDVESVCQSCLRLISESARRKQLSVCFEGDGSVRSIRADEIRLKQILLNLLSNAVKFTPESGKVGLTVRAVPGREIVEFTVWDTGAGIAPTDLDTLFQPFARASHGLARLHPGAGLGLSLALRLTELHRGGITVTSEVDQGSRFTVTLPWQPATAVAVAPTAEADGPVAAAAPAIAEGSAADPPLVLVAEDDARSLTTLSEYLIGNGYRVVQARDGQEAVRLARETCPAAILMDVRMPLMNGLQATREIRLDRRLASIPILMLAALARPGDRERAADAGVNCYLTKPINLREACLIIESLRRAERERV